MKYWVQYVCCLFVILFFAYVNSANKEGFIPKVREYYRPIARKARLWKDQVLNMSFLSNRLKRMGVI
jgi:hypothetical protein